jgi:predicted Zn-dependent protease with MMP-like domain
LEIEIPERLPRAEFEQLVIEAIDSLPQKFLDRLENVDIVVESTPTKAQLLQQGIPEDSLLLGLYEGVPLTARENYGFVLPDKITIFQEAIETVCPSPDRIVQEVRETVAHEIAHHFGLSDEALETLGL